MSLALNDSQCLGLIPLYFIPLRCLSRYHNSYLTSGQGYAELKSSGIQQGIAFVLQKAGGAVPIDIHIKNEEGGTNATCLDVLLHRLLPETKKHTVSIEIKGSKCQG